VVGGNLFLFSSKTRKSCFKRGCEVHSLLNLYTRWV